MKAIPIGKLVVSLMFSCNGQGREKTRLSNRSAPKRDSGLRPDSTKEVEKEKNCNTYDSIILILNDPGLFGLMKSFMTEVLR